MAERGAVHVTVVGATDVGRVREHNEDNLLVADLTAGERSASGQSVSRDLGERGMLLAVADGMGGAASGELASKMAVDVLFERFEARGVAEGASKEDVGTALDECIGAANGEIYRKSQAEAEHRGMGTTMTAAFALGDSLTLAQVGDSRAYLMRKGKLTQVTKDQSLISQLIEDGTLTPEEAEKLGGRNIILQALGVEADVSVEQKTIEVLAGDLLVLCSDGLSTMLKDEQIQSTIAEAEDLELACARLITLANEEGGKDNITVILVRYEGEGLRAPMRPLEVERSADPAHPAPTPTAYVTPEVPEEKRSIARPLAGAAGFVVVVVVLVLLLGGGGTVTFVFPAVGATARLVPEEGGEDVPVRPGPDGRVSLEIAPGHYTLFAELDRYEPLERAIDIGRGEDTVEVPLLAKPGTLKLTPGTPRSKVRIQLVDRKEWEPAFETELTFAARETREIEAAAGKLHFDVQRDGFRSETVETVLEPAGDDELTLPALTPVTGRIEIPCAVPGAVVKIVDENGDEIFRGEIPGTGPLEGEVRVGTHHLEIEHPRYQPESSQITVVEGEVTTFDLLKLVPKKGSLLIKGPPGKWVTVGERQAFIKPDGEVLVEDLTPGSYTVELDRGAGTPEKRSVEVRSAETVPVEFER